MVVFLGREFIHVLFGIEADLSPLSSPQVFYHLPLIYIFLEPQIHHSILIGIQQIVTLVLRIRQTELALRKFVGRMNLKAQVAAAHGIEEIETDGEALSEACPNLLAQQFATVRQYHILRGELHQHTVQIQIEAVLLGDAVEAPSVVLLFAR